MGKALLVRRRRGLFLLSPRWVLARVSGLGRRRRLPWGITVRWRASWTVGWSLWGGVSSSWDPAEVWWLRVRLLRSVACGRPDPAEFLLGLVLQRGAWLWMVVASVGEAVLQLGVGDLRPVMRQQRLRAGGWHGDARGWQAYAGGAGVWMWPSFSR